MVKSKRIKIIAQSFINTARYKWYLTLVSLVVIIVIELLVLEFLGQSRPENSKPEGLKVLATNVLQKCSKSAYKPSCYDEEIPKLMSSLSMEETFEVTRLVQERDSSYYYCHVLGHKISAIETAKDPSKWKEVVARSPRGVCSNGAIHGAFQERFRKESLNAEEVAKLKPDLMDVCEKKESWSPTGMEQATCYHALGHLTMYITDANVGSSLSLCSEIAQKADGRDYKQLCFDGVFMQIFQPLEPEDIDLVRNITHSKESHLNFCQQYPSPERDSCWSEGWPLFQDEVRNPEGLVKFCSVPETAAQQDRCFSAMVYVLTPGFKFEINTISEFCNKLPDNRQTVCFSNAATRMIETDKSLIGRSTSLCVLATEVARSGCYEELIKYSTYTFVNGSKEFYELCNNLPVQWQEKCLSQAIK